MLVGVPDGLGAYLVDNDTVSAIAQSESYGPIRKQSYPFPVNDGAASFTGSLVQYVDYHRNRLSKFMNHDGAAFHMEKRDSEKSSTLHTILKENLLDHVTQMDQPLLELTSPTLTLQVTGSHLPVSPMVLIGFCNHFVLHTSKRSTSGEKESDLKITPSSLTNNG